MNNYSLMAASTPVIDVYLCHYFDKALDALEIEAVFSTDSAIPCSHPSITGVELRITILGPHQ